MDPGADSDSPSPDVHGGDIGAPPPAAGGRLALRSDDASVHSHRSTGSSGIRDSLRNNPPSLRSPSSNSIILRISPAAGSATFGYVYMAETELRHQDAIIAYFDSAGREVSVSYSMSRKQPDVPGCNIHLRSPALRHPSRTPYPRGKRVRCFSLPRLAPGTFGSFELPSII